jgi:Cof subfamily protein (haloacid dehalogenase superfamily)
MSTISLVAVDLDGTLLTSRHVLAPEGARLLGQAARAGVHVVLATTRNPNVVQGFCRSLEIDDPIICTNGAQVWGSPAGPVWACHTLPADTAQVIARWADERGWELSTTVGPMTYWRQRPGQTLGPIAPHLTVVRTNVDAITGDPVRILVSQPDAVESIRSLCQSRLSGQCRTETYHNRDGTVHSLGIFALQADKGTALALVRERLGAGKQQTMAIGDNSNDLPMFAHAGIGVAMGNAPDPVKQMATAAAPGNDEEGVAWAISHFVLTRS